MTTLMGFILNTVQPRINDPGNARLWLPRLLVNMTDDQGKPVLPIRADYQNLGYMAPPGGDYIADRFADVYSVMKQVTAEPNPAQPRPLLEISQVVLDGLQNMFVDPPTVAANPAGYDVSTPLLFNHYSAAAGGVPMPPLTLSGRYRITQSLLVTRDDGTQFVDDITGDGSFSGLFSDCKMTARSSVTIAGSGAQRYSVISVGTLVLGGITSDAPTLAITNLTLDGDLKQKDALIKQIRSALNDPEGQGALIDAVTGMLNTPDTLASINSMLSGKSGDVMQTIFGPLPPEGMPSDDTGQKAATPVDLYLFDRMRAAMIAPESNWYLPWQLASSSNPVLEPYTGDRIALPSQTIKGLVYSDIVLTDVCLAQASNALAPVAGIVLTTPHITANVVFGPLPQGPERSVPRQSGPVTMPVPPAPPMTLAGNFTLTQNGFRKVTLTGHVNAIVTGLKAALTITPSGASVTDLFLTIGDIVTNVTGVKITVDVQLVPRDTTLEQIVKSMFEKPEVQTQIAQAINSELSGQLDQLSQEFSAMARAAINQQLSS